MPDNTPDSICTLVLACSACACDSPPTVLDKVQWPSILV